MDLIRQILMAVEDAEFTGGPIRHLKFEGHSEQEVAYHVMLLHEGGLVHALSASRSQSFDQWYPAYLTWEGHEFLEAARDDTRWNHAKDYLKEKGGPMIFEVLKAILLAYVNQKVFGK
jgi:hypothetical protein